MAGKIHRGWRYFICDDCGIEFREECRDHETLSSSACPNEKCRQPCTPYKSHEDEMIVTDGFGNLFSRAEVQILRSVQ